VWNSHFWHKTWDQILAWLVPATSSTNSNWFEFLGQLPATCSSKRFVWTVTGKSPYGYSPRVSHPQHRAAHTYLAHIWEYPSPPNLMQTGVRFYGTTARPSQNQTSPFTARFGNNRENKLITCKTYRTSLISDWNSVQKWKCSGKRLSTPSNVFKIELDVGLGFVHSVLSLKKSFLVSFKKNAMQMKSTLQCLWC